ncbi:hypothetical protein RIF29_21942 [Crotalaria pallida]|uniref:Uncharacterized protein n=1 Tax=Crotalaria pallida TaxID=3830 RepID=A0AAN9F5Q4_CROPI
MFHVGGAIGQLTKNLACEWARDNIRTNCVAPWFIRTPITEAILNDKDFLGQINSRTPIKTIFLIKISVSGFQQECCRCMEKLKE